MSNAIAKVENQESAMLRWSPEQVDTIRHTVAKGASDYELEMFLHLSQTYGLDPFAKEIWFVKMGNTPTITTSRDGYLKIANRNPHFQGISADVVYEGDSFRKTKDGVEHVYGARDRGQPIGAYCFVYRDDRVYPVYVYAPFKDYRKGGLWNTYPHAMILKVAEAQALKRAFGISGLVTREELEAEYEGPYSAPVAAPRAHQTQRGGDASFDVKKEAWRAFLSLFGGDVERAKAEMLKITGGRGSADWTPKDLENLRNAWAEMNTEAMDVSFTEEPAVDDAENEDVGPVEAATDSGNITERMYREIEALLGETGLGLTRDEGREFIFGITGKKELEVLSMADLEQVVREAKKAVEAKNKAEE